MYSFVGVAAFALMTAPAAAQQASVPIESPAKAETMAAFDIVKTDVKSVGPDIKFRIQVRGEAGEIRPKAIGQFAGSAVYSYVWPTSLNSSSVGFEADQGILALAVTFHPDFDDAANGGTNRHVWHPHWVVLVKDEVCGPGALKVRDIPEETKPKVPPTWPNVPLLIDSPTYPMSIKTDTVEVAVPAATIGAGEGMRFDGVTSALKVNANLHAPLLCISDIFDVASGNLGLPGKSGR